MAKKYRVTVDCHWRDRYWNAGEQIEFADDVEVIQYFQPIDKFGADVVDESLLPPKPMSFSEINKEREKSAPKTGMAYQPQKKKPVQPVSEAI